MSPARAGPRNREIEHYREQYPRERTSPRNGEVQENKTYPERLPPREVRRQIECQREILSLPLSRPFSRSSISLRRALSGYALSFFLHPFLVRAIGGVLSPLPSSPGRGPLGGAPGCTVQVSSFSMSIILGRDMHLHSLPCSQRCPFFRLLPFSIYLSLYWRC